MSVAYQLGWEPYVEVIGDEGTYVAVAYSRSRDLAGVARLLGEDEPERVGFAPESRLLLGLGEWVLEGIRVAFEYSRNRDYDVSEGGTGGVAHGFASVVTIVW